MCNTWEKQLVMYIGSAIGIGFFSNNEYRILETEEKFDSSICLYICTYVILRVSWIMLQQLYTYRYIQPLQSPIIIFVLHIDALK